MILPQSVLSCIQALENAGFSAYVVGGCVRDFLLGRAPQDFDLCTNATPEQICQIFSGYGLVHNGKKHGTVGVVMDGQLFEITTFRTEGGYEDNRHPDWVQFVGSVEEDLARRDFTVNAMAYNPKTGVVDPFGGQADLQTRTLRAVGDPVARFAEDALRILRGVRFAVRFHLTAEENTQNAMLELAPRMENLARERVFSELCKLLPLITAEDFLKYRKIFLQILPELQPAENFNQNSPHHRYDVLTHTAYVLESVPPELPLRWAALLHDVAKPATYREDENGRGHFYGHAQEGAKLADAILHRLRAPTALREQVVFLITQHMTTLMPDKKLLRRYLGKWGQKTLLQLLALQQADFGSKGTGTAQEEAVFGEIRDCIQIVLQEESCLRVQDLAIGGAELMALGFSAGPKLGKCLNYLLEQVQDEFLPNEKDALLSAAKAYLQLP